jgi:predicted dehydrogenase
MIYQRDASRRIRLGMVGVGSHAYRNILPTLTYLPVELIAVADIDAARAAVTARQYGARSYADAVTMYEREKLDAVLLAVSPALHPRLAIDAMAAGLHVWMEKPAGLRAAPVRDVLAARNGKIAMVGYKKAFAPATLKARQLLAGEGLKPIRNLFGIYRLSVPANGREVLDNGTMTNWLNNGCHPLSALVALGGPVEAVQVIQGRNGGGTCLLFHRSGAIANLHLAEGAPGGQPLERYAVFGGTQSIEIENTRKLVWQRGIKSEYAKGTTFAPLDQDGGAVVWEAQDSYNTLENKAVFTQGLFGSLDHFCAAVLGVVEPGYLGSLEFAVEVTQIYEAALLSEGRLIEIEPLSAPVHAG